MNTNYFDASATTILTAEEFLTLVLAKLRLSYTSTLLQDRDLDWRFERAYEVLCEKERELGVTTNFTFYRDPLHGNSIKFRNAMLTLRERQILGPSNRPGVYELKMTEDRAKTYLKQSVLAESFLEDLVNRDFISGSLVI